TVRVPARFPVRAADRLREEGFTLVVSKEPFFPRRAVKTPEEILRIEAAQEATEEVMLDAIEQIRRTEIRGDELHLDGETLTAERLKMRVRKLLLERGYNVGEIIVAPGDQGCDPHNTGSGPLRAGETIIIDIFPRHIENRYWGDMTRTVVKGEPSSELRKLHAAVEKAQRVALEEIGPGVRGADVHRKVSESLEMDGFATTCTNGTWKGFFHGTGHGVGLDIHEAPRLSKNGPVLEEGMVVTVEPGLYYPGLGGVRIEDLVVVTADGCRNLNRASRELVV
ncbi:MAG: M24 family metallopeptidase, partial [Planctomycetota bacterium]